MRDYLNPRDKLAQFERVNNRLDYLAITLVVAIFVLIVEVI